MHLLRINVPFNFERFTDTETSFAARITVRQTGQFGFNVGAINRFHIRDYSHAVLYFDPTQRVVGIELTKDRNVPGAIEIKQSDSNTYIRAKNFCDRYGVDYSKMSRHELKQDRDSEFLYFALDEQQDDDDDGENNEQETTDNLFE